LIQHIVLLKLKPGTTDEQVDEAFTAGGHLPREIPGVLQFVFGRDRSDAEHGFTIASIIQLRDEKALETFLKHPKRRQYIDEHVAPITEQRIEVDVPTEGTHRPLIASSWFWGAITPVD
jgi:stress responsive alpha/beta barrel protein